MKRITRKNFEQVGHGRVRRTAAGLLATFALALTALAAPAAAQEEGSGCGDVDSSPAELGSSQLSSSTLCLLNEERADQGLAPLRVNGKLAKAALRHTNDMLRKQFFAHQGAGGPSMVARIKSTGYIKGAKSWVVAENIAWGTRDAASPSAIVDAWMNSPGHRRNILDGRLKEIGLGIVIGTPSDDDESDAAIFTTDFGRRN